MDLNAWMILEMCQMLSQEHDVRNLTGMITSAAMELTKCDGGTLYMRENEALHFSIMITKSKQIERGFGGKHIDLPPVPLHSTRHVCACAARNDEIINIEDTYLNKDFDFSGTEQYDERNSYRTRSMICVPLKDKHGKVFGLMQLINAQDAAGRIVPFSQNAVQTLKALSSLASVCLRNASHYREIAGLLDAFALAFATAADIRGNLPPHYSRDIADDARAFCDWLEVHAPKKALSAEAVQELRLCLLLRDIGKLMLPNVLEVQASRLGARKDFVLQRLRVAALCAKLARSDWQSDKRLFARRMEDAAFAKTTIMAADEATEIDGALRDDLKKLAGLAWADEDGKDQPFLTREELAALAADYSALSRDERKLAAPCAEQTARLLSHMKFPAEYRDVPRWIAMRHEYLDGSGFPKGLRGDRIPKPARMLTLLGLYGELTAKGKPLATPLPPPLAIERLRQFAAAGKIDAELLELLAASKIWERKR